MSRDVTDLLQRTADEPTRALDTGAVIGRAKRQTTVARLGAGLGVVALLALVSLVASPLVTGSDLELEIADGPDPDQALDGPASGGFTLGESYVWRSEPGSPDDAGLAFASQVLGWDDASIIHRTGNIDQAGNLVGDPAHQQVWLTMVNADDRTVELHLVRSVSTPEAWEVNQVAAGTDVALRMTEEPSLVWRPQELDTELHRPFEGSTGVAYVRTLERGTVTIELDQTAIANARVPLDGHIEIGDPFCHTIQTTLLLFRDDAGVVVSAVGGVWYGGDPPDCDAGRPTPDSVPRAEDETDLPKIAEQLEDHEVHPDAWVTLQAGDLALSVPSDWTVRTVEPTRDPAAQAGPCASDLYGGIGNFDSELAAPLVVVYPMETTGICRAIGLPGHPPEQPSIVLYAGIASDRNDDNTRPPGASSERVGTVRMVRLESEPHEHFVEFQARDGQGGLFVSHLDDPLVREVLATLIRTIDVADG